MYQPISLKGNVKPRGNVTVMAPTGENDRDLPQLLDVKYAQNIINYIIYGQGRLEKREGYSILADASATDPVTFIEWLTTDIIIFGYGTTIASYSISTDTISSVKSDFSASDGFDGARYGSYMYIVNGVDSMQRIQQQITYSGQTQLRVKIGTLSTAPTSGQVLEGSISGVTGEVDSFNATTNVISFVSTTGDWSGGEILAVTGGGATIGDIDEIGLLPGDRIVGGASGANAVVASKVDTNPTGTLVLKEINGIFQNAETITAGSGESATTTSAVTLDISSVDSAPIGSVVRAIGPRLFVGNLLDDDSAVQYSDVDTGDDPPFNTWNIGTSLTSGDVIRYKSAGAVRSIEPIGNAIFVLHDNGFHAFGIQGLDSSGTLSKLNQTIDARLDFGGARGAINTKDGIFYANEGGLYQLAQLGSKDIPFSGQTIQVTRVLQPEEFQTANLTNADIVYDEKRRYVYLSYATDESETSNAVLAYHLDFKALSRFDGFNINRFMVLNNEIYFGSAVSAKIYRMFDGTDDDGLAIGTEYTQELNLGSLSTVKNLRHVFCGGELSANTELDVRFDIYDEFGRFIKDKLILEWTATYANNTEDGWGLTPWGEAAWGGSTAQVGLGPDFAGRSARIKNLTRIRARITGSDKLPHRLNWLSLEAVEKRSARRRNLTKV